MPKSLMQISQSNTNNTRIRLTDINPNLTGHLGKLGFFNADWTTLKNNQFYNVHFHQKHVFKQIKAPMVTVYPIISLQQALDNNMAFQHDNLIMWPFITNIYQLTYKNTSSIHPKKTDFKFSGELLLFDTNSITVSDLSQINNQYRIAQNSKSYDLSGDFPVNATPKAKQLFKDDFANLSIYQMLYNQLKYMTDHAFDIYHDHIFDSLQNDHYYEATTEIVSVILNNLDQYKQIQHIDKYEQVIEQAKVQYPAKDDFLNELLINNMHLMLMDSVAHLKDNNTSKLTTPIARNQYIKQIQKKHTYTNEQLDYITSTKRNIVAEAGAGTGKSTALGGRISYLKASGIDPSHILVLSFTNAAADNITNHFPGVKSYTIASVINGIYSNYYNHHLSDPDTLRNSLILARNNPKSDTQTREDLIDVLYNISSKRGYKKPDFDQYHHDILELLYKDPAKVTNELNIVNQTTLELQQSIIYFVLNYKNVLPQSLKDIDFILIDEAQDTSLFELIFLTRLATIIDADINFIGDANQTLYEFRDAYARSLNIISNNSNVSHYVFDINHRSNDYILTMANQILKVLSTNEKTQMQLISSHNKTLTSDGYQKAVKFLNNGETSQSLGTSSRVKASSIALKNVLRTSHELKQYIDNSLQKNEQIAFLALSRNEVQEYYQYLTQVYGESKIEMLTPLHTRWSSLISDTLLEFTDKGNWKIVNHYTVGSQAGLYMANALSSIMFTRLSNYHYTVPQWATTLVNTLPTLLQNSQKQDWETVATKYLENGEIKHNAVANSLKSQDKVDLTKPIIISTIHSAKGLEFPHVVLHYMESNNNADQSTLRALGVGLTRAKDDEFIINSYRGSTYTPHSIDTSANGLYATPLASANKLAALTIAKNNNNNTNTTNLITNTNNNSKSGFNPFQNKHSIV